MSALPTQEELRGNAEPLLRVLAENILDFRARHLHEGSDYHDAITNGQKPLALVSQCIDGRQPVHTITGMPLGKLIAQSSIAGFLCDYPDSPNAWASILFGIKSLGAPVIIKLGHTGCGGADKLIELCLNEPASSDYDPTIAWLQAAMPLAREVVKQHAGKPVDEMTYIFEEELVRDGVRKLESFVALMIREGHLEEVQRPVIVGLLFEMHTAKLYHLLPDGKFDLLSKTLKLNQV